MTRMAAMALLTAIAACAFTAGLWTHAGYETQFRETPDAAPSAKFLLGTDALGRDRLSRLVYGTRVSLALAPAAAGFSCAAAALLGGLLLSYHAFIADAVLMLPAGLLLARDKSSRTYRMVGIVLLSPLAFIGYRQVHAPYPPAALVLLPLLAMAAAALWRGRRGIPRLEAVRQG